MTALRQKMIEDMQLHGFAERTQESYLRAVRQLAAVLSKSRQIRSTKKSCASIFCT